MSAVTMMQPEDARHAVNRLFAKELQDGFKLVGCHRYNTAGGNELFRRVRLKRSDDKHMRPMYRDGIRYRLGEPPAPPQGKPLYVPPYPLVETDPVFVVEGEACADALAKLGLTATTSGGASSADAADWTPLRGRSCIVWPDNDGPGIGYAAAVVAKLRALGCNVRMIDKAIVEALPEHGDCVDWIAQHPNATADDVRALAAAAPSEVQRDDVGSVELVSAADVQAEPIRWLWPGWLARGKLHVLAGAPGTGKTTLAMDWAACVSSGRALPSGCHPQRGRIVIWSGEDDPGDTLKPRLIAANADLGRIDFVGEVTEAGQRYPFDPARDVDKLAAKLAGMDGVAMIVIDPLVSAVMGDSHKNAEVRRSLAPLVDLAARMDAALLGITHYSKGTQGREPLERVSGSLAFGALARVVLGTVRMQADDDAAPRKMMLARCKSNIGPDGGGFAYAFEQVALAGHGGMDASRIVWGAAVEGSARELLAEAEPEGAHDDAANFLRELLADGPRPSKEVFAEAGAAGYSKDAMHRAKRKIGAEAVKEGGHFGDEPQRWVWRLPPEGGGQSLKVADKIDRHLQGQAPSSGETGPVEVFDL